MRAASKCRACEAPIRWAVTEATGKRIPLNAEADPEGNIYVDRWMADGTPVVIVVSDLADIPRCEALRYTTHFATCPRADEFRRPR